MLNKRTLTFVIIAVVVAVVAAGKFLKSIDQLPVDSNVSRGKGDANARVKIIEFIDFQCPACAHGSKILKEYTVKYPQDLHVQGKYFPLVNAHRHAMSSALYSECAGRQGMFWQFHEPLMEQQGQWSPLLNSEGMFRDMMLKAGVDLKKIDACLNSQDTLKAIEDDRALGKSLGVQSTPTYFINNKMVVGTKSLTEELDALLK